MYVFQLTSAIESDPGNTTLSYDDFSDIECEVWALE